MKISPRYLLLIVLLFLTGGLLGGSFGSYLNDTKENLRQTGGRVPSD